MTIRKYYTKKQLIPRYLFGAGLLVIGIVLNMLGIGDEFFSYESVGNYLIFVGLLILFISTIFYVTKKKKVIDERMEKIGYKASRITFSIILLVAFLIMIIDGINKISIPYQLFMSYFICGILLVYIITYKIIEREN